MPIGEQAVYISPVPAEKKDIMRPLIVGKFFQDLAGNDNNPRIFFLG
jgi:hypothetical protein